MNEVSEMNKIAAKSLGSDASYAVFSTEVDSSLLNFMPRAAARSDWGITGDEFDGFDVWHCYEATFLTTNGLPVSGTLKLVFPVSNEVVVESKSLKLYLNTFDMTKMGDTVKSATEAYVKRITDDLNAGKCFVQVGFFDQEYMQYTSEHLPSGPPPLAAFKPLERAITDGLVFTDYRGEASYTKDHKAYQDDEMSTTLCCTNILRSRCRHTKQKDSGAAFFSLTSKDFSAEEVLREVITLREVNEFHEFCAEKLFVELAKGYNYVVVILVYCRRGGIDINPIRYSKDMPKLQAVEVLGDLIDVSILNTPAFGQ